MELEAVQAWLNAYLEAWRGNEPEAIGALFSEDATYAYNPWDEPVRRREAIVVDWLKEPDEPDAWPGARPRGLSPPGSADRATLISVIVRR